MLRDDLIAAARTARVRIVHERHLTRRRIREVVLGGVHPKGDRLVLHGAARLDGHDPGRKRLGDLLDGSRVSGRRAGRVRDDGKSGRGGDYGYRDQGQFGPGSGPPTVPPSSSDETHEASSILRDCELAVSWETHARHARRTVTSLVPVEPPGSRSSSHHWDLVVHQG